MKVELLIPIQARVIEDKKSYKVILPRKISSLLKDKKSYTICIEEVEE